MLGRVVHLVDDLLPERVRPALAARVAVLDHPGQAGVGQAGHKALRLGLEPVPARTQRRDVGNSRASSSEVGEVPRHRESQIHCAAMMCTSVSRIVLKLAPPGFASSSARSRDA